MSSQRYHPPSDQRYPPPDDSRFVSRDRSPPRYGGDRFPPAGSSYRGGGYQPRPDVSRDSNPPPLNRDVPRGPRASFDQPRGRGSFSASIPRGRGFTPRADYRGGFRGGDVARPSRDSDSWVDDPDRSWRAPDRTYDSRDRRPSPPPVRARQPEFRDFRDAPPSAAQREADFTRPRGPSREPSHNSPVTSESRRDSFSQVARSYIGSARGRAEWEPRGRDRDRDRFNDDRQFRPRSRSPFRDPPRRDLDTLRNRNDADSRDDRRYDARDRSLDRDDRDRPFDRYARHRSPVSNDALRQSPPSTASSISRPVSPGNAQPGASARPLNDFDRDASALRRLSSLNQSAPERRQSLRHGSYPPKPQSIKDLQDSRASSPPQAPEVPAFGSLPFGAAPGWNVWKPPPADPKPQPQSTPAPSLPPAPKATSISASTSRPGMDLQAPTAPRAERMTDSTSDKATASRTDTRDQTTVITPKSPTFSQSQATTTQAINTRAVGSSQAHRATSPPVSPTLLAPTGPRTSPGFASTQKLGANVPTGPKADRVPPGTPTGPASSSQWQWQRPGAAPQPSKPAALVPAKRDLTTTDERSREQNESGIKRNTRSAVASNLDSSQREHEPKPSKAQLNGAGGASRPATRLDSGSSKEDSAGQSAATLASASFSSRMDDFDREDPMELDEDDFEKKELRFQREKARLESELVDLSSRRMRGASPLEQLARLHSISLISLPPRALLPPSDKDETILGTGHLLTPKAEAVEGQSLSPLHDLPQNEPPPVESPELRALPFLHQGPPTPIEDLDLYKKNLSEHSTLKNKLAGVLEQYFGRELDQETDLREEYARFYLPWIATVEQMDAESKDETPIEKEAEATTPMPAPEPSLSVSTPVPEGRRRGQNTEYDLERVIQESLETANREEAKRIKQEQSAKFDPDKETQGWPLEQGYQRNRHYFVDKTSEIKTAQVVSCWNFRPPVDRFTETDHDLLVQKFWDYPKKWGKLAQELDNRYTFKECINHYYATKWNKDFKEKRDKRKYRTARGRLRANNLSGRPKANALISNLGDVRAELYDGDEFSHGNIAMTDRGRPRRAAAPTFGEKEGEDQAQSTITPGRKGAKQPDNQEDSSEKPGRRSRNAAKEKPSRRNRGQPPSRPRSQSPEKLDNGHNRKVVNDGEITEPIAAKEHEMNGHLRGGLAPGPPSHQQQVANVGGPDGIAAGVSQPQRTGPTSYWSVQEVSAFRSYLVVHGTNWGAISSLMGTKTGTMVKNYYHRLLNQNNGANQKELEDIVKHADQKREREEGQNAPSSNAASAKRDIAAEPHLGARPVSGSRLPEQPLARHSEKMDQVILGGHRSPPVPYLSRPGDAAGTELGHREGEPGMPAMRGTEPPIRQHQQQQQPPPPPPPPMAQQPLHGSQYPPREMFEYDGQARTANQSTHQPLQSRPISDSHMPGNPPNLGPAPSRYFAGSPPQSFSRIPLSNPAARSTINDGKPEDRPYHPPLDHGIRALPAPPGPSSAQSNPNTNWLRGVRSSSPMRDPPSSQNPAAQPAGQAATSRAEPRKVSSLAAILNADDNEPRRGSANSSNAQRTATPPASQQYSSRPPVPAERHHNYSDPALSRQASLNSPPALSRSGPADTPQLNQTMPRQSWHSPPAFPSMLNHQGHPGHPLQLQNQDRQNAGSPPPSLDYHRQPLQPLGNRHVPSPPPAGLGFGHPSHHVSQQQSYRQALQDNHHRPMSPPHTERGIGQSYSPLRAHHYPGQDPNHAPQQSLAHQGSFGAAGASPHRRDNSDPNILGRPTTGDPGQRYGSRYQQHAEEPQSQQERESRSSLRPDSFMMHGGSNYGPGNIQPPLYRRPRLPTDAERRGSDQGHAGHSPSHSHRG